MGRTSDPQAGHQNTPSGRRRIRGWPHSQAWPPRGYGSATIRRSVFRTPISTTLWQDVQPASSMLRGSRRPISHLGQTMRSASELFRDGFLIAASLRGYLQRLRSWRSCRREIPSCEGEPPIQRGNHSHVLIRPARAGHLERLLDARGRDLHAPADRPPLYLYRHPDHIRPPCSFTLDCGVSSNIVPAKHRTRQYEIKSPSPEGNQPVSPCYAHPHAHDPGIVSRFHASGTEGDVGDPTVNSAGIRRWEWVRESLFGGRGLRGRRLRDFSDSFLEPPV